MTPLIRKLLGSTQTRLLLASMFLLSACVALGEELAPQQIPQGQGAQSSAFDCANEATTIAEACPELYAALDHEGLVSALDLSAQTPADAQLVAQLQQYLAAAQTSPGAAEAIDSKRLDDVIAENYRAAKRQELSFMERLGAWWDSLFGDDEQGAQDFDYWKRFIPTESLARIIFYALSGLLLAFLLVYGWRELQPFLEERRTQSRVVRAQKTAAKAVWPPAVAGLPGSLAMGKVFSALVQVLTERQRLPQVPGLTHSELANAFAATDASAAETFKNASQMAATVLFTEQDVSAEELTRFLQDATRLVQAQTQAKNASALSSSGGAHA